MWKKSVKWISAKEKYLNSDKKTNYYLDLTFYDTSLHLRFQGFIDTKRSSFFIDINEPNCVRINSIIGLIYYVDENGENKHDTIVTNIYINFQSKKDINFFFNSLCWSQFLFDLNLYFYNHNKLYIWNITKKFYFLV